MDGNNLSANSQNIKKFNLQQKGKTILLVAVVVVPVFIGAVAYILYKNATRDPSSSTVLSDNDVLPESDNPEDVVPTPDAPITDVPDPASASVPPPSSNPGQAPAAAPSGGMPDGVTTAINSLESSGLKGNPYVSSTLDTSQLPDGASVKIDRSSWTQYGSDVGAVNGTVTIFGQVKAGSLTFALENGAWRVTGYSLDE